MDLSEIKYSPPCEPVKNLMYVAETDEVISEFEHKFPNSSQRFNNYKQLSEQKSREWFCSPELIKFYEYWDCKNLNGLKHSWQVTGRKLELFRRSVRRALALYRA